MMKWIQKVRVVAASLSCFTIVFSPLAQASQVADRAAYRKNLVKTLVTEFGAGQKAQPTIGDYYVRIRAGLPADMAEKMDTWVALHRLEPMPKLEVTTLKDADGTEEYRFLITHDKQTISMTTGNGFMQIGSQKVLPKDWAKPLDLLNRVVKEDPYLRVQAANEKKIDLGKRSIKLSEQDLKVMSPEKKALYFLHVRNLVENADRVMTAKRAKAQASYIESHLPAYALFTHLVFGDEAFCKTRKKTDTKGLNFDAGSEAIPAAGSACIVAGWVATYDERGRSCGGETSGRQQWESQIQQTYASGFKGSSGCSAGSYPCNPMVYGFNGDGGSYCVDGAPAAMKFATRDCNNASPLNGHDDSANARRIVESWVKAQGKGALRFDANNRIDPRDYAKISGQLEALEGMISNAEGYCGSDQGQKTLAKRPDQGSACEEIRKRRFALEKLIVREVPPPPMKPAQVACEQQGGMEWKPPGDCRACRQPALEPLPPLREEPLPPIGGLEPAPKRDGDDWMSNKWVWGIGGLVLGGALALGATCLAGVLSWCEDKKNNNCYWNPSRGVYVPPTYPTCATNPMLCGGTGPIPVTPTVPVPTPTIPTVIPGEGGSGIIQVPNSGGVR